MQAAFSASPPAVISGEGDRLALEGAVNIHTLSEVRQSLQATLRQAVTSKPFRALDISRLSGLDTPGALFLCNLRQQGFELAGVRPEHQTLLDLIGGLDLKPLPKAKAVPRWRQLVIQLGKGGDAAWRDTFDVVAFVGRAAHAFALAVVHPRSLRPASISRQIAETGIHALPIVGLMAVMISVVIGYQGVAQLRGYGAEGFTINLVAVSMLREMGVLITAIMVAGRSGSAFTAEIGVMKAREEIDALEAMGMDPIELLVLPRLIGLVITLTLLTFFADVMGLLGGAMIAQTLLHVAPLQYLDAVRQAADLNDFFVGMVKAPIFAFFIGVIGCMHGLRGRGSAESVGQETTRAVVKAIFLVIVLDALFSVLFEKLGI
jgi:phospholipid/cholesterol/gamma-HCH transport system permease protein